MNYSTGLIRNTTYNNTIDGALVLDVRPILISYRNKLPKELSFSSIKLDEEVNLILANNKFITLGDFFDFIENFDGAERTFLIILGMKVLSGLVGKDSTMKFIGLFENTESSDTIFIDLAIRFVHRINKALQDIVYKGLNTEEKFLGLKSLELPPSVIRSLGRAGYTNAYVIINEINENPLWGKQRTRFAIYGLGEKGLALLIQKLVEKGLLPISKLTES